MIHLGALLFCPLAAGMHTKSKSLPSKYHSKCSTQTLRTPTLPKIETLPLPRSFFSAHSFVNPVAVVSHTRTRFFWTLRSLGLLFRFVRKMCMAGSRIKVDSFNSLPEYHPRSRDSRCSGRFLSCRGARCGPSLGRHIVFGYRNN